MSRIKKSRKPASAPKAKPKLSKKELANVEKRVRKSKGKPAGNKQKEALAKKKSATYQNQTKNPRLGSKKPIPLVKTKPLTSKVNTQKTAPIAAVKVVEPESVAEHNIELDSSALVAEIELIEQDQRIHAIVAQQENDEEISEQDIDYYNSKMARHQEICDLLGWHEDEDDEADDEEIISDDKLWDKLDNSLDDNDFNNI